jgi:hypothetical protein
MNERAAESPAQNHPCYSDISGDIPRYNVVIVVSRMRQ